MQINFQYTVELYFHNLYRTLWQSDLHGAYTAQEIAKSRFDSTRQPLSSALVEKYGLCAL